MDTSRLLEVLEDVEAEFTDGYQEQLQQLLQQYAAARDNPTQDLTEGIRAAFDKLAEFLADSHINIFPPSKQSILAAIGGQQLLGTRGLEQLRATIQNAGMTAAGVVSAISAFIAQAEKSLKACKQARAGLSSLSIEPHAVAPGDHEIGVRIPTELTQGKLVGLTEQLAAWNQILRGVAEVAGEEEREVGVKGLATGSAELYVVVGLLTAKFLAKVIDKLLEWYKKILEIQEARQKLSTLGAPVAETTAVKQHEKSILDRSIKELVSEMLEQSPAKLTAPRRNELDNHLTISIRQIAKFVDAGGTVEVRTGVPDVPEEPEEPSATDEAENAQHQQEFLERKEEFGRLASERERALDIARKGASLSALPTRDRPILQLDDGDEEGAATKDPKSKRKE